MERMRPLVNLFSPEYANLYAPAKKRDRKAGRMSHCMRPSRRIRSEAVIFPVPTAQIHMRKAPAKTAGWFYMYLRRVSNHFPTKPMRFVGRVSLLTLIMKPACLSLWTTAFLPMLSERLLFASRRTSSTYTLLPTGTLAAEMAQATKRLTRVWQIEGE